MVRYPPFINARQAWWPMEDPTDQPITQDHDRYTLERTIQFCRERQFPLQGTKTIEVPRKRPREGAG